MGLNYRYKSVVNSLSHNWKERIYMMLILLLPTTTFAQYKVLHTDIVQIIYPEIAMQTGTSVANILIDSVAFDTTKQVFIVKGRAGGLEDNRDDSVYLRIDMMRAGKLFKNYCRSEKDGNFKLTLLSTDQCKVYGLDDHYAFISIKQPVIRRHERR